MRNEAASLKRSLNWRQIRAMLQVAFKRDWRSRGGSVTTKQKRRSAPVVWSLLIYGFMSTLLAVNLSLRASLAVYMLFTLAYAQLMTLFFVLMEFGQAIMHPDDAEILGHLPIDTRTFFWAKTGHMLIYVALVALALTVGPAMLVANVADAAPSLVPVYLAVGLLACLSMGALVIWGYGQLLRLLPENRFKDLLAVAQGILAFTAFLGYQLIPRLTQQGSGVLDVSGSPWWFWTAPPAWFASLVTLAAGPRTVQAYGLAALAVAASAALWGMALNRLSFGYAREMRRLKGGSVSSKPGADNKARLKAGKCRLIREPVTRAGFDLAVCLMKRDRNVKMGIPFTLGIPLAFWAMMLLDGRSGNPLGSVQSGNDMGFMTLFFLFFMLHSLLQLFVTSPSWQASWIMKTAPIREPGRLYQGLLMALLLRCVLPFMALLFIGFGLMDGWRQAALDSVFLGIWSLVFLALDLFTLRDWPLSKPRIRGDRNSRFAFLLFLLPFFTIFVVMMRLVGQWPWAIYGLMLLGIALFILLNKFAMNRLSRRLALGRVD